MVGKKWLEELGYKNIEESPMGAEIALWWSWYTATAEFFESTSCINKRTFKVKRITIKPAKMVCEDWASLLFNERTEIGVRDEIIDADGRISDDESLAVVNEWLTGWLNTHDFMDLANFTVERAMALGTAGWALRLDGISVDGASSDGARIIPMRYDARHIIPLSWDGTNCTECAFVSPVNIRGQKANQMLVYRLSEVGTYDIHTAFFADDERRLTFEGYTDVFQTGITTPPFALVRPAIDNTYLEYHPFGVSVFDEAMGAVRLTDLTIDNLNRDIYLGEKLMFLPSSMLEKDAKGNTVIPRASDQQVFTAFEDEEFIEGKAKGPYEYNPDLRVEGNRLAIKTALELLGKRCGFGKDYYSLDERGGGAMPNRTATEVASDATELMRNLHKHERAITPAIEQICTAVIGLANQLLGTGFPDVTGKISIVYGDSIIEDDAAVRARDREDVAAGLMAGWQYIAKWQAVDEATAKDIWAETQGGGTELP
jgi:A118 family predicted phage portal protein